MPFTYQRTIRFSDTDAAGVVYFANVLSICHEGYEALLASGGIDLTEFFSARSIAVPIVHASIDFLHPMRCGDGIEVQVEPAEISTYKFKLNYRISLTNVTQSDRVTAIAHTIHLCIKTDCIALRRDAQRQDDRIALRRDAQRQDDRIALRPDAQRQDDRREKTDLPQPLRECLFRAAQQP